MSGSSLLGPFTDLADGLAQPAAGAPADLAAPVVLAFDMQRQEQSNWCWAAVASSVCGYYAGLGNGQAKSQCQIATEFLGRGDCCITPYPPASAGWAGNAEFSLQVPLSVLGHFSPPIVSGTLNATTIAREIGRGRPICCHIEWGARTGHFVAIIGYDSVHNEVIVRDPGGTIVNGALPLNGPNTFSGGTWTETYLTA